MSVLACTMKYSFAGPLSLYSIYIYELLVVCQPEQVHFVKAELKGCLLYTMDHEVVPRPFKICDWLSNSSQGFLKFVIGC